MQFDADTVGAESVAADAEMCMLAADTLEALGVKRGDYVIKVTTASFSTACLSAVGLDGDDNAGRRLTVLRAVDKLDRLGIEGVSQLLGKGRKDESGDFTKGADLTPRAERWKLSASSNRPIETGSQHTITLTFKSGRSTDLLEARRSDLRGAPDTMKIASASTSRSCAALNITPAPSSKPS